MEQVSLSGLSLQDLRVLVEISRAGSVSGASLAIDISQPAASYSLDKARRALGDRLFVRVGRRMQPTPFGETLVTYLDRVFLDLSQITSPGNFNAEESERVFRVIGFLNEIIGPQGRFVDSMLHAAPNIGLNLVTVILSEVDTYLKRDFDLYFGTVKKPAIGICSHFLGNFEVVVYHDASVAPAPTELGMFLERDFVGVSKLGSWIGAFDEKLLVKHGQTRRYRFEVPNLSEVVNFVKGTDRLTTLSSMLHWSVLEQLDCAPLPLEGVYLPYELRWSERLGNDPAHTWFRENLIHLLQNAPMSYRDVARHKASQS